jgi:hypothetical protein
VEALAAVRVGVLAEAPAAVLVVAVVEIKIRKIFCVF